MRSVLGRDCACVTAAPSVARIIMVKSRMAIYFRTAAIVATAAAAVRRQRSRPDMGSRQDSASLAIVRAMGPESPL